MNILSKFLFFHHTTLFKCLFLKMAFGFPFYERSTTEIAPKSWRKRFTISILIFEMTQVLHFSRNICLDSIVLDWWTFLREALHLGNQITGKSEAVRSLILLRLYRARMVSRFLKKMEKDIRINYMFTRIVKLITVELYCTHTAACIFYYLATTLPPAKEGNTWIGSLTLGDYKYLNFREIDLWTRYITSLYFAIVTMATVGM